MQSVLTGFPGKGAESRRKWKFLEVIFPYCQPRIKPNKYERRRLGLQCGVFTNLYFLFNCERRRPRSDDREEGKLKAVELVRETFFSPPFYLHIKPTNVYRRYDITVVCSLSCTYYFVVRTRMLWLLVDATIVISCRCGAFRYCGYS